MYYTSLSCVHRVGVYLYVYVHMGEGGIHNSYAVLASVMPTVWLKCWYCDHNIAFLRLPVDFMIQQPNLEVLNPTTLGDFLDKMEPMEGICIRECVCVCLCMCVCVCVCVSVCEREVVTTCT